MSKILSTTSGSTTKHLLAEEDGSSMFEFSLSIMLLLMTIFGIMDCSRALYAYHFVGNAARDATRYAMVRGSTWGNASCANTLSSGCTAGTSDVSNFVKASAPVGFATNSLTVNTTWTGKNPKGTSCSTTGSVNDPGCLVSVKVIYSFNFVLPFLPKNTLLLSSNSNVVFEQ